MNESELHENPKLTLSEIIRISLWCETNEKMQCPNFSRIFVSCAITHGHFPKMNESGELHLIPKWHSPKSIVYPYEINPTTRREQFAIHTLQWVWGMSSDFGSNIDFPFPENPGRCYFWKQKNLCQEACTQSSELESKTILNESCIFSLTRFT